MSRRGGPRLDIDLHGLMFDFCPLARVARAPRVSTGVFLTTLWLLVYLNSNTVALYEAGRTRPLPDWRSFSSLIQDIFE